MERQISKYIRFEAQYIGHSVRLISRLAGLGIDTANGVDEVDTSHPLVYAQFDLAGEIMEMTDQRSEHEAVPLSSLRAHGVDDTLSEGRVIFGRGRGLRPVGDASGFGRRHVGEWGGNNQV